MDCIRYLEMVLDLRLYLFNPNLLCMTAKQIQNEWDIEDLPRVKALETVDDDIDM